MGPVSFDVVELGSDRSEAMRLTSKIRDAGLRVDLREERLSDHTSYRLFVRSTDFATVRSMLDDRHTERVFPAQLLIEPLARPPSAVVRVPGSKSHTNRALVCAALAEGTSTLSGVLFADDTEAMLSILETLGFELEIDRAGARVTVRGHAGSLPVGAATLNARKSGTTSRFILPMLTLGAGRYVLDGHEQMRARPFDDLVAALDQLGARLEGNRLPLVVHGDGRLSGGAMTIGGSVSSQFLSALLLVAPCAADSVEITIADELVSKPYIDLTLATMRAFGVEVENDDYQHFMIPASGYRSTEIQIEPDASAASYFFAAAAITGGRVRVEGLGTSSIQGDVRFAEILEQMGADVTFAEDFVEVSGTHTLRGVDVDMSDISDTAQTLAVVAPFADSPTRVRGIGFIRRKETDRIAAVVTELRRLGIDAAEEEDGFVIQPGRPSPGLVTTYDDHRMAMSFSLLGLVAPGIEIDDPSCVSKTFPDFFDVLAELATRPAPTTI